MLIYTAPNTKEYQLKDDIKLDNLDMRHLYDFFKNHFKDHEHPLALLSIANAIAHILRTPKNSFMDDIVQNAYGKDHPGHTGKINSLVKRLEIEEKKQQVDLPNDYQNLINEYHIKCSEAVLEYLGGEESIENVLAIPMEEYTTDEQLSPVSTKRNIKKKIN